MNSQINDKLKKLIKDVADGELHRSEIAVPFVPYVGPRYQKAATKVLVVGKATYGWKMKDAANNKNDTLEAVDFCRPDWFEKIEHLAGEFIEEQIIPFYSGCEKKYNSLFWNRIYHIVGSLLMEHCLEENGRCPIVAETAFRSFAWTNVFKIASKRGNPKKSLIEKQIELNTLGDEIQYLKPHVILFFTGRGYDRNIKQILPESHVSEGSIARVSGLQKPDGFQGIALRTYHPQYRKFRWHEVLRCIKTGLDLG